MRIITTNTTKTAVMNHAQPPAHLRFSEISKSIHAETQLNSLKKSPHTSEETNTTPSAHNGRVTLKTQNPQGCNRRNLNFGESSATAVSPHSSCGGRGTGLLPWRGCLQAHVSCARD